MKANVQVKASVLTAIMAEDRQEIRGLRSSIYNVVSVLTLSSFALTSFLLDKDKNPLIHPVNISLLGDTFILVFIWAFFARYKQNLRGCRQALVLRQNLISKLDEDDASDLNPFGDPSKEIPDVTDIELWWIPILATVAVFIKMVVLWRSLA
jgi:hypothetical protein